MSHSTSTSHYNLPQFAATDKPAWLTDVNPAYSAIDAGMYAAQQAADAAQGDATQALDDAAAASGSATAADSKASGAIASISESFDATATYSIGDLVIYNNLLYKCTTPVTNPGPWSGTANWTRATVDSLNSETDAKIETKLNITDYKKTLAGRGSYSNLKGGGWADRVIVTVNFDTPMPNINYAFLAQIDDAFPDFVDITIIPMYSTRTSTSINVLLVNSSGSTTPVSGSFSYAVVAY